MQIAVTDSIDGSVRGLLAHGVGGRQDLPIPFSSALIGAMVALLATFLILGAAWRTSRFRGGQAGRPLPAGLAGFLDSAGLRWTLRAAGLLAAGWLVLALVAGPAATADNPAAGVLYVVMWVWVPVGSVLLGPVWRAVSPVRTVHLLLAALSRTSPDRGPLRLPPGWGLWPAAATLFGFVWLELVPADRATVPVVFLGFVTYAVVMLVGGALVGSQWFARADPFEVYSSLAARLAPVGRREDRVLVWRNPFEGLDSTPAVPGLAVVVLVLLGSTAFDSLSGSTQWLRLLQDSRSPVLTGTLGLAGTIGALAVAYLLVVRATGRLTDGRQRLPAQFAHSLLPIVLGYMVAHYYSLAVLEGQRTVILGLDPLGTGSHPLGLSTVDVNPALVGATTVVTVQVVAVVLGHIGGAVAAHDRAVRLFPPQAAQLGQLPLLLLMVGYTGLGLSLLFAA
ncbi:MAG: hypothetical protein GEV12_20030 [Micromonosporaceae bacterium]|nr:hypothetical protein [Micromonosporaceae bacterium]